MLPTMVTNFHALFARPLVIPQVQPALTSLAGLKSSICSLYRPPEDLYGGLVAVIYFNLR